MLHPLAVITPLLAAAPAAAPGVPSGAAEALTVATSLLAIALVGAAGVASYLATGRPLPPDVTGLVVLGGVGSMGLGTRLGRRISGPELQKIFAAAIVLVAAYIVLKGVV